MLPSTLLGLLFAVAALGPGFLYVRQAERGTPRARLSALAEGVEMLAIGATTTLAALLIVVAVNQPLDWVSVSDLDQDAGKAVADHPVKWLLAMAAVLGLSYAFAALLAWAKNWGDEAVHVPHGTGWQQAFRDDRPKGHDTWVTVCLRDGRLLTARLRTFTSHLADDRELVLYGPIKERAERAAQPSTLDQQFLVVREADVLWVEGHYHQPAAAI